MAARLETWEPGNATRYELALVELEGGGWLFAWPRAPGGGRAMVIPAGLPVLHASYLAERMGLPMSSDLLALLAFLAERLPAGVKVRA